MENQQDFVSREEMLTRIRAAIEDRGTWFALLFQEFAKVLPPEQVEAISRKAIFEFGKLKAQKDPQPFTAKDWVTRHVEKGSAEVFDSEIDYNDEFATQHMRYCPLVEAWKKLGCTPEEVQLYCDIAMEGDRGRAAGHDGIRMELGETLATGCDYCDLRIVNERL